MVGDKAKSEQVPTMNKKDEGYVSAEKDQNDNAQDNVSKQRDGFNNLLQDKTSPNKGIKRLSTEEPITAAQDPLTKPANSWSEFFAQQQMMEEQQRKQQKQQQHGFGRQGEKNVMDAYTSQQQQYEAMLMMMNSKSGDVNPQTLAYMQQYMKVCILLTYCMKYQETLPPHHQYSVPL